MYLLPQSKGNQVTESGQAQQQMQLMEPDTRAAVNAFAIEAAKGIGTGSADLAAYRVKQAEKTGTPLTDEQYQQSEFYRPNIKYYRGITDKAAEELAKFDDATQARAEIINDATTGQAIAGYGMAFAVGVMEPKNVATGLATSLVLTPAAGAIAGPASSIRRLMKMRQTVGQMSGRVALGAIEGGVSAAIAEPSNQYSARTLQQDYTMADSMWNVALSTAFGVGASAAGIGAKEVPKFVRDKWDRHGVKAADIIANEMDTAVTQLAQGKRVDVGLVERSAPVANKPVAEKAAAVESFVKYTETPEFKTRFEGSKIVDESGAPLMVFHGTGSVFDKFSYDSIGKTDDGFMGRGFYFTPDPKYASAYAEAHGEVGGAANVRPAYLDIKNPYISEALKPFNERSELGKKLSASKTSAEYSAILREHGHDGVYNYRDGKISEINVLSPDQIISAFGADDMDALAARMDNDHASQLQKYVVDDANDLNDTAIDDRAAAELDAYEEQLALEKDMQALDDYNEYIKEIAAMKREGILSEADETEMLDAINSIKEKDLTDAYQAAYLCLTRG